MKTLVLGSEGQVGRALLARVPETHHAIGLARSALDITDEAAIDAAFAAHRPGLVINAAAYTAVDRAESEVERAFSINATAPSALSALTVKYGAHFVHISTDFVFDGTASTPYLPASPTNPVSVYGASKLAGEVAVRAAAPDALIVRTAWVYAAGGRNFVETMLRLMATQPSLRVVADQIGTPTHADSLAAAIWQLAGRESGTLHFTDAGAASWYDFAVAAHDLGREAGLLPRDVEVVPIATADYPTPARRPAYSVLDKATTWAALGRPARHWRHELALMMAQKTG